MINVHVYMYAFFTNYHRIPQYFFNLLVWDVYITCTAMKFYEPSVGLFTVVATAILKL